MKLVILSVGFYSRTGAENHRFPIIEKIFPSMNAAVWRVCIETALI
jgi:hypothetical protein